MEVIDELGLSPNNAAEMLVPQAVTDASQPRIALSGKTRIPISPGKKMLMQNDLLAVRSQVDELLGKLEKDPDIQKRARITETLSDLGISYMDAAELLYPGIHERASRAQTPATRSGQRQVKYWKNPHSGEVVKARSNANGQLRSWVTEHGEQILKDWRITEEEAPEAMRDS